MEKHHWCLIDFELSTRIPKKKKRSTNNELYSTRILRCATAQQSTGHNMRCNAHAIYNHR